jgi:hypothetical protein
MVPALFSLRNEFNFITGATAKNDFTLKISCATPVQCDGLCAWKKWFASLAPLLKPTRQIANLINHSHRNNGWKCFAI